MSRSTFKTLILASVTAVALAGVAHAGIVGEAIGRGDVVPLRTPALGGRGERHAAAAIGAEQAELEAVAAEQVFHGGPSAVGSIALQAPILLLPRTTRVIQEALEHLRAGRYAQASRACEDLLRAAPDDAHALHLLGMVRYREGRPADAVALLRRAAAQAPADAEIANNLGNAYQALGAYDEAITAYTQALAARPDFSILAQP
mgnify:CR=1 FL=1